MSWNAEPDGMPKAGADERPRAGVRRAAPSLGFLGIVVLTVAVAGTWATSALVLERHAGEQHRARMRRDVENHRAALARRVQIANQELYRAAAAFAGAPAVGRGVAQRDRDAVKEALHDLGEVHGWDLLVATDYLGRVLASVGEAPPDREVLASHAVDAAVAGEVADTFWLRGRNLFQVRIEPVRSEGSVRGALAVGKQLDRRYLAAVRGGIAPHLRLERGGRTVLATAAATPTLLIDPLVLGRDEAGEIISLRLMPVAAGEGPELPWDVLTASAGLWLLGSMVLGFVALRSHRDALEVLAGAADRLGRGELQMPVDVHAPPDVRRLETALEGMRVRLRAELEDAEGRCRELAGALDLEHRIGEQAEHRLGAAEANLRKQEGREARELAHEFKTPAATVGATMTGVRFALAEWLGCLQAVDSRSLTPEQGRLFHAALQEIDRRGPLGRPAAARREALAGDLGRGGVRDADRAARILLRTGLACRWQGLLPLLRRDDAGAFLSALEAFSRIQVHLRSGMKAADVLVQVGRSLGSGARNGSSRLVDVRLGLDDALMLLDHEMRGRVELRLDVPTRPPMVRGDGGQLCQVWTNLIHNAVQAMGEAGGNLDVEARVEDGWVIISVTDTGPGVDESVRERIFEPYVTTKSQSDGSGIGLSVVQRIVDVHGGKISVESEPGRTRFEVRLPSSQPVAAAVNA